MLIGVLLILSVVAFVLLARRPEGRIARVEVDGRTVGRFPLAGERSVEVEGPLGVTEIRIGERGAEVICSPCPQQFCVRAGRIHRNGQVIACVPNRVVVRILGRAEPQGVDAVTR